MVLILYNSKSRKIIVKSFTSIDLEAKTDLSNQCQSSHQQKGDTYTISYRGVYNE